jgi:hypothetical protein
MSQVPAWPYSRGLCCHSQQKQGRYCWILIDLRRVTAFGCGHLPPFPRTNRCRAGTTGFWRCLLSQCHFGLGRRSRRPNPPATPSAFLGQRRRTVLIPPYLRPHVEGTGYCDCASHVLVKPWSISMMSTTVPTTMSTQTQVEPTSVRQLLRAYDVHQTGQEEDEVPETLIQHLSARARESPQSEVEDTSLPSHIPDDVNSRRAVPPHRPIGDHTLASRPGGPSRIEGALATFAFVGVYTIGVGFKLPSL